MKVLFVTSVHPSKKSGSNSYISNLISHMKKTNEIEMVWIVCEKDRIVEDNNIFDIRRFSNGIEVLEKIRPDIVFALNNKYEPINRAMSISSKFKKIPLIHFKVIEKAEEGFSDEIDPKKNSRSFQKLLNIETNSKKKKILDQISFILYKHNFLYKTRSKMGIQLIKRVKLFFEDFTSYFREKQRIYTIANLQLVNNKSWYDLFVNLGFDEKNLALTGSPYWDPIFGKIQKYNSNSLTEDRKIRVLIITSPLVEHGYGTYLERDDLLKNIFQELDKEKFEGALKIHPSSERKESYQKILDKNSLKIPIFQNEKLWDIIHEFDIIVTYGYGYPQIECAFGGIRTILLKTKWKFPELPIVKAAIKAGYFKKCQNFHEINKIVDEMMAKKVAINNEILHERENICFKFDGKSSERASKAIFDILERKN